MSNKIYQEDEDGVWEVLGKARILVQPSQSWIEQNQSQHDEEVIIENPQATLLDKLADEWEAAAQELRSNRPEEAADALSRAAETARQSATSLRGESRDS